MLPRIAEIRAVAAELRDIQPSREQLVRGALCFWRAADELYAWPVPLRKEARQLIWLLLKEDSIQQTIAAMSDEEVQQAWSALLMFCMAAEQVAAIR